MSQTTDTSPSSEERDTKERSTSDIYEEYQEEIDEYAEEDGPLGALARAVQRRAAMEDEE